MTWRKYFRLCIVVYSVFLFVLTSCEENTVPCVPRDPTNQFAERISHEDATPNKKPTKYAVLINGSTEIRFAADIVLAYQILVENGFERKNTYIINAVEENWYWFPIDGLATTGNVKALLDFLAKKVTKNDLLFMLVTDHGGQIIQESENTTQENSVKLSTIILQDGVMNQKEIREYLNNINPQLGVFLIGTCFGGGFAEEVGEKQFVAIAGTKPHEVGFADESDSFIGAFMMAFRDVLRSDGNLDGKVSINEAFEYARIHHSYTKNGKQVPMIVSALDPKTVFLTLN